MRRDRSRYTLFERKWLRRFIISDLLAGSPDRHWGKEKYNKNKEREKKRKRANLVRRHNTPLKSVKIYRCGRTVQ